MVVRLDSASKRLCELSGWTLSHLALQKLLYLSQVEFAAQNDGEPMIGDGFEAWDYGPVVPRLYQRLSMFGRRPVRDVFTAGLNILAGSRTGRAIQCTWDQFGMVEPGELIELTHWERGGWAKRYDPGRRNVPITQADIADEARARLAYPHEWRAVTA